MILVVQWITHVSICQSLFIAVKSELKPLEYYYFYNCIYDGIWKDSLRRSSESMGTWPLFHSHSKNSKLVLIGYAAMASSEIEQAYGSIEHVNLESGSVWVERFF